MPVDESIGPRRLEAAKDRLIAARATHLDSLGARLNEPRVQRIVEPLLTGEQQADPTLDTTFNEDVSYVRDLGLVARTGPLRIANPIYNEVIPRVLAARSADTVTADPRSFVRPDGTLDFDKLLADLTDFWKQHGEVLTTRDAYHEAAPLVERTSLEQTSTPGGHTVTLIRA